MNELAVLKWAAAPNLPLPDIGSIDDELLTELVAEHRLINRLFSKMEQHRPAWCPARLMTRLRILRMHIERHLKQQLAAAREVAALIPEGEPPPIFIKGFSTYALTGNRTAIRYSSDLDVFCHDPEALTQALIERGYRNGDAHVHEFAHLTRKGVAVEIHNFFPVWSYPVGLSHLCLDPGAHPGEWIQLLPSAGHTRIFYDDLRENCSPGAVADANFVIVPDPGLSALLLCAHEFKEVIEFPFRLSRIRLAAIADIYDLTQHPHFDRYRFQQLVDQFRGHDAVAFIGKLMQAYFGANPFSCLPPDLSGGKVEDGLFFAQVLSSVGGWASLSSGDDLLLPSSLQAVIERLGSNSVMANIADAQSLRRYYRTATDVADRDEIERSNGDEKSRETLDRVLVQTMRDQHIPIQIGVTSEPKSIEFEIQLFQPLESEEHVYNVQFCTFTNAILRHEIHILRCGKQLAQAQGGPVWGTITLLKSRYSLIISISRAALKDMGSIQRDAVPATLPVLLSIGKSRGESRDPASSMAFDPIIVLPLSIQV